ncbi:MAG: Heat shock protein 15 [Burkholderia sp.]|jgi:ribosome-associated heat shock protein Hsp15
MEGLRIDKWLWAARFFKTRTLAQDAVELGRVLVGGQRVKVSREVKPGDTLQIRRGDDVRTVRIEALSDVRGPASQAQTLYRETEESVLTRAKRKEILKLASEPASTIRHGRPTKREGRRLREWQESWK